MKSSAAVNYDRRPKANLAVCSRPFRRPRNLLTQMQESKKVVREIPKSLLETILKALVLKGPKEISLLEVETPQVGDNESIVKVEIAGIGGSEYLAYRAPGIRSLPSIMGHGFAGIANGRRVAVDPVRGCGECKYCHQGFRQLCDNWSIIGVQSNGGLADCAVVPTDALVPLPESLSWEQAAFIEPFANSINAWSTANAKAGSRVAVIGAGGLGLGIVACASAAGCENVSVSDLSSQRLLAAETLGAQDLDLTQAYDIVFDTVGSEETRAQAISLTDKHGTCVWMGFAAPSYEIATGELIRSQKTIIGAFAYSAEQFCEAVELAHEAEDKWVKNLKFSEVEEMLAAYLEGDFSHVKSALRPSLAN